MRQTSTGGQSGTSQTPEAGSRRPSFTPYGAYPPGSYSGDPMLQTAMIQKAFYEGWADAAAAAARGKGRLGARRRHGVAD